MNERQDEFWQLAARLAKLQEQARSLGIFADDRELLQCARCGLLEDVSSEGLLVTCLPSSLGQNTGMRFQQLSPGQFRCPRCGDVVESPAGRWWFTALWLFRDPAAR